MNMAFQFTWSCVSWRLHGQFSLVIQRLLSKVLSKIAYLICSIMHFRSSGYNAFFHTAIAFSFFRHCIKWNHEPLFTVATTAVKRKYYYRIDTDKAIWAKCITYQMDRLVSFHALIAGRAAAVLLGLAVCKLVQGYCTLQQLALLA